MMRKKILTSLLLLLLLYSASAAENATIYGYVTDRDTGKPLDDIVVEIFSSADHSAPVASVYTDIKGSYNASVPAGQTYDIYVRLGKVNPSQSVYLAEGYVQKVDFEISMQSVSQTTSIIEDSGFSMVVVVAVVILVVILFDQVYLRKKRVMRDLEAEKKHLEKKLAEEGEPMDELSSLKKERDRINYMVNLTKTKYHQRKLDEESFREIVRDYQKTLIEIETKIEEMEKDKK